MDNKKLSLDDKLLEIDTDYNVYTGTDKEIIQHLKSSIGMNEYYTGFCTRCDNDGNLYLDVNGIECIMERNEVSITYDDALVHKGLCQDKVGKFIKCKVIEVNDTNPDDVKVYLSRKDFVAQIRKLYDKELELGCIVTGQVTNINESAGVFVNIGGDYTGIIPRSNLENLFVSNLSDHVNINDKVEAVVIEIEKNKNGEIITLTLDRRSLLPDFSQLTKSYNVGDVVIAKVKSIEKNGIYCSLNPHLDIICDFNFKRYRKGQAVKVRINKINTKRRKIVGIIQSEIN